MDQVAPVLIYFFLIQVEADNSSTSLFKNHYIPITIWVASMAAIVLVGFVSWGRFFGWLCCQWLPFCVCACHPGLEFQRCHKLEKVRDPAVEAVICVFV